LETSENNRDSQAPGLPAQRREVFPETGQFPSVTLPVKGFREISAQAIAEVIVHIAGYEKTMSQKTGGISVYVMNAPRVAAELKNHLGQKIGNNMLSMVIEGSDLPRQKPEIIYAGDLSSPEAEKVVRYARRQKILSVSGKPAIISKGITLGIGASPQKNLEILINLTAALSEGLDWNAEVMNIARMY
jgi:hypothetical protein